MKNDKKNKPVYRAILLNDYWYVVDQKHYCGTNDWCLGVSGKVYPPSTPLEMQMKFIKPKERINIIIYTNNPIYKS